MKYSIISSFVSKNGNAVKIQTEFDKNIIYIKGKETDWVKLKTGSIGVFSRYFKIVKSLDKLNIGALNIETLNTESK